MKSGDMPTKFFAAAAAHIMGRRSGLQVSGSPEKLEAVREVLGASRDLYRALHDPSTGLEEVTKLVERKRVSSVKFRNAVGLDWIL